MSGFTISYCLFNFHLQLSHVHQAWYINNVVHHVLRHVIPVKIQIVAVVVLKDVFVQVDKLSQRESALINLIAKVFNSTHVLYGFNGWVDDKVLEFCYNAMCNPYVTGYFYCK